MTSERKAELRDLTHYYGVEELLNALDAAEQEIESYKAEVKRWKQCELRSASQIVAMRAMFDETNPVNNAEIARLRKAIGAIADSEGDAQIIARQALGAIND
jgi:cell division septum initiation protein DivIVA